MKDSKRQRNNPAIIIGIVVLFLIIITGYLATNAIYHNGYEAGKAAQHDQTASDLSALGQAIQEKTTTITTLNELNASASEQATTETISEYISKLDNLIPTITNPDVKAALEAYRTSWQQFQETYASEDNSAIEAALADLRSSASDTSIKITDIYNTLITTSAEKLPD